MAEAPRLIVFSDTSQAEPQHLLGRFSALAARARPGSVLFYLRDYQLPLRARWELAKELQRVAGEAGQGFGFAERADVARALGCSAFHVPEGGLSAADARAYLGPSVFLSRGSHDPLALPEAELDAILLSPVFQPRKGREALGVSALEGFSAAQTKRGPLIFALGGVDAANASACLSHGAAGVAVIGAALAPDPTPLLAALGILAR